MDVNFASPHLVDTLWPSVADGLEHACAKSGGDIDSHYLWTECRSGRATLIIIHEGTDIIGASVWRIERWSTGKVCRCLALYGKNMKSWVDQHVVRATELAKLGHADRLITEGRKGFERMFPEATVLRQTYEMRLK